MRPLVPYQQRVVDEKAELDERLGKLQAFLGTPQCLSLSFDERGRLAVQAELMRSLSDVLGERIAAFN